MEVNAAFTCYDDFDRRSPSRAYLAHIDREKPMESLLPILREALGIRTGKSGEGTVRVVRQGLMEWIYEDKEGTQVKKYTVEGGKEYGHICIMQVDADDFRPAGYYVFVTLESDDFANAFRKLVLLHPETQEPKLGAASRGPASTSAREST
jgi:hypothetical protein